MDRGSQSPSILPTSPETSDRDEFGEVEPPTVIEIGYPQWRQHFTLSRLNGGVWIAIAAIVALTGFEAIVYPEILPIGLFGMRLASIIGLLGCWGLHKTLWGRGHLDILLLCFSWSVTLLPQVFRSVTGLAEFEPHLWSLMFFAQAIIIPVRRTIHLRSQLVPLIYFGIAYGIFRLPLSPSSTEVKPLEFLYLGAVCTVSYVGVQLYERLHLAHFERYRQIQTLHRQMENTTQWDPLTGLANRRRFDDFFNQEWRRNKRDAQPLSLILCRIDAFKYYKYIFGREKADECLQQVAGAIARAVKRPADLAARYRPEAFGTILPNTTPEGALQVANNIRSEIEALRIVHPKNPASAYVTLSLGVSGTIPQAEWTEDILIVHAGEAWSEAKAQGGDRVVLNPPDPPVESD